jgi:hypothetical protein
MENNIKVGAPCRPASIQGAFNCLRSDGLMSKCQSAFERSAWAHRRRLANHPLMVVTKATQVPVKGRCGQRARVKLAKSVRRIDAVLGSPHDLYKTAR